MAQSKDSLDSILEKANLVFSEQKNPSDRKAITLWVPESYKKKYVQIQNRTGREFTDVLKKIIMKTIDRIDLDSDLETF